MLYASGVFSLLAQLAVGVIDALSLGVKVEKNDEFLKDLLKVEMVVQVIEFIFYVWLFFYFSQVSRNITPFRYLDWSFTTPMMLITLSGFLQHDGTKTTRLLEFLSENSSSIIKIVLLNACMLMFGLFGEFGYLSPLVSTGLGFIPFIINFIFIKEKFLPVADDKFKNAIFYWFLFFWSLYGIFPLMSYKVKNIGYNILDIFSKNFFGLFLAYIIHTKAV
jgi:hypothetical protein